MTKLLRALLLLLVLGTTPGYSQEILKMMDDPSKNFFEVQKFAEEYFKKAGTGRGSCYKIYKRWEFDMMHKIDAKGNRIDPTTIRTEFQTFQKTYLRSKLAAGGPVSSWKELGPHYWNQSAGWNSGVGRVTSICVDPNNSNTIYITSPGGGCWKSTTAGTSWTPLTDNEPTMDFYSVAVKPGSPNTVFVGTNGYGLMKSDNGGTSWTYITAPFPTYTRFMKIVFYPGNANIMLLATSAGIYRSTDGGTNWTQSFDYYAEDIEFKPNDPQIVYATGSVFMRSTNGGISFTATNVLPTSDRTLVSVTPANPNMVYLVQARGSEFGALFRSTDAGLSFQTRITGDAANNTNFFGYSPFGNDTGGQAGYDMAMCVSPTNADEVYIAGIIVWKSSNGGSSFTVKTEWVYPNQTGYIHADVHVLEYVGSTIYSGSDGGIYKSIDGGEEWTDLSRGLGIRQFYRIGCSASRPDRVTGGAQDNGTSVLSSGGWMDWIGADGMETFIDYSNADIMYGTSQNGGLYKSLDGGKTRVGISRPEGGGNWITPWVIDPQNPNTSYVGISPLWKTTDGGNTWNTFPNFPGFGSLDVIAVAPSNNNYIFASTGGTIYRTKDGGNTWTTLNHSMNVSSIAIHATNPEKLYVSSYNGFSSRVLVSTNAGDTFTDISGNLPGIAANCVVVDNSSLEGLYVAMQTGIYYKNNTMSSWVPFSDNLPKVAINELEINYISGKIRAATYGRGLWESPLYNYPTVTITSPVNQSLYTAGTSVTINATASDPDGSLTKVEFYNGTTKLGEDLTSPYSFVISSLAIGEHNIYAKAIDNNGNVSVSAPLGIYGLRAPENPTSIISGINYSYYEGLFESIPNFSVLTPVETGTTADFNLNERNRDDEFGFEFNGFVEIPADGIYKFYTTSDDGSMLYIGSTLVVNNDGLHGPDERMGSIALKAGKHSIKVQYAEVGGGETLEVRYEGPGLSKQLIPSTALFRIGSNTNPTATITEPLNNATFTEPATVTISATANDADGTISRVEFYRGTTLLGTDYDFPYFITWVNVSAGTYNLTAKAIDNNGGTGTSPAVNITVNPNPVPTVSITAPANNASFNAPASITIEATASDAHGISKVEFYNGATKLGEDPTSPYSLIWNSVGAGTYTLTAKAFDIHNASATSTAVTVTVITNEGNCGSIPAYGPYPNIYNTGNRVKHNNVIYEAQVNNLYNVTPGTAEHWWKTIGPCGSGNQAPTASITSPASNTVFTAPANITINASATDSDGSVTKVEFFNGTTKLGEDLSNPYSYNWNGVVSGTYSLTVKSTDNQNATTTSSVVTVIVNNLPTVSITAPVNNASFTAPASITINATATDNDGTVSKVEFYNGATKLGEDLTSPYSYIWTGVAAGNYALTAKAIDNRNGTTTSGVVNISVTGGNVPPTATITSPTNNQSFTAPASITINATATDSDGSVTKVEFYNGATKLGEDLTSPYSYNWTNVAAGNYALTAKSTDNGGASTTSTVVNITVSNNVLPTANITSPANNASFTAPATITINATATDSDGSISKVEFYNGATKLGEDASNPYSYTWSGVSAGTYTLSAKAYDNLNGTTTSPSITVTVSGGGCSAPQYVNGTSYTAGARVKNVGNQYECKPWPYTGWCGAGSNYEPGVGFAWQDAWTLVGPCAKMEASTNISNSLKLYPNPTEKSVTMNFVSEGSREVTITISDMLSNKVAEQSKKVHDGENFIDMDLSMLENGVYLIIIENGTETITERITVIK